MNVTTGHAMQVMEYVQTHLDHLHVHVLQDSLVMDLLAQVKSHVAFSSLYTYIHIFLDIHNF